MTVIAINEDSHGYIGVAKDYSAAIDFLINENWLDECVNVFDEAKQEWLSVEDVFGPDWRTTVRGWNLEQFNLNIDQFLLVPVEVYGA